MRDIEEIMQDTKTTHLLLKAFQSILHSTADMLFIKDENLTYQAVNMPFVQMVGKKCPEDVLGHTDFEIFDDYMLAQRYVADDNRLIAAEEDTISFIEPITEESGHSRFARTTKYVLRNSKGEVIGLAGISKDVTHEIIASENHQKELEYLFELPEDAYMAVYIDITDWRIVGEKQQEIQGVSFHMHEDVDALAKKACRNVVNRRDAAYLFYRDFLQGVLKDNLKNGKRNIVMEYLRRFDNGEEKWVRDEIKFLLDPSNHHQCLMLTVRDINERKQEDIKLLWAAERDGLTGLLNRASIIKSAKKFLAGKGKTDTHAVFMIDIDNFKQINDTYGHQAGDRFLVHMANIISKCFRDSDLVGRIGGDEFMVLMKFVPNANVVKEKGLDLLSALKNICNELSDLNISGSIGVSLYDQDGDAFEELYEKADQAMYVSKRSGKAQLIFASELDK